MGSSDKDLLDRAFVPTNLSYSPNGMGDVKAFVLQDDAYYNLEAYLKVGISLPPTLERFQSTFPRSDLVPLIDLDQNIYGDLEVCLLDIYSHCHKFNFECFGKFLTVSYSIINFCDSFDRKVRGKPTNLKDQLVILGDETVLPTNPQFTKAMKLASRFIENVSDEAKKCEDECNILVGYLRAFLLETQADNKRVKVLHEKLIGPRADDESPYTDKLMGTLAEHQRKVEEAMRKAKAADKDQPSLIRLILEPTWGPVTRLSPEGMRSVLQAAHDFFESTDMMAYAAEHKVLITAINMVQKVCGSIEDIDAAINHAIGALENFAGTFSRLQADFTAIRSRMADTDKNIADGNAFIRELAKSELDAACEKWMEIKTLAFKFVTFKSCTVKDLSEIEGIEKEQAKARAEAEAETEAEAEAEAKAEA